MPTIERRASRTTRMRGSAALLWVAAAIVAGMAPACSESRDGLGKPGTRSAAPSATDRATPERTGARPSAAAYAPNVLLVTVDTLRADRLGAYGYAQDTSPTMDALAARGVLFSSAGVQWPKTWPSMASFMTGTHPKTNGIGLVPRILPDSFVMLAEIFHRAGYDTAAVVANFNVGRSVGFDQGFDHFVESWEEKWQEASPGETFENAPGRVKAFTDATLVTDQALRWLWDQHGSERPFFLWLHYMDPHGPYLPPTDYASLFEGAHASSPIPDRLLPAYQRQSAGGRTITDLAHYQAQYDREIRYFDDQLGRLFEQVEQLDVGPTLVVLTADHGESMGEHDYYLEHGELPYEPTAHVPLIVAGPGVEDPGRSVDAPVGLIDVAPTLVELAGLTVPEGFEGASLLGALQGRVDASLPEHVFMQSGTNEESPQLSVRRGRWKLIHVRFPLERRVMTGSEYELYDLAADPGETRNLVDAEPDVVAELARVLDRWYGEGFRADRETRAPAIDVERLAPSEREMLKALGYIE